MWFKAQKRRLKIFNAREWWAIGLRSELRKWKWCFKKSAGHSLQGNYIFNKLLALHFVNDSCSVHHKHLEKSIVFQTHTGAYPLFSHCPTNPKDFFWSTSHATLFLVGVHIASKPHERIYFQICMKIWGYNGYFGVRVKSLRPPVLLLSCVFRSWPKQHLTLKTLAFYSRLPQLINGSIFCATGELSSGCRAKLWFAKENRTGSAQCPVGLSLN